MQIDSGIVIKLLMVRLETALSGSGVDLVAPGRLASTAETAVWTRIARVTCTPVERPKGSTEVDRAMVVAALHVAVGQAAIAANAYELHEAMGIVAGAIANVTLRDIVALAEVHRLDLSGATQDEDAEPFDSRLGKTGCVTVTGFVERLS